VDIVAETTANIEDIKAEHNWLEKRVVN